MLPLREINDSEIQQQLRDKVWDIMTDHDLTFETAAKEMRVAHSTLYQFIAMKRKSARSTTIVRLLKWIAKKEKLAALKKEQEHE